MAHPLETEAIISGGDDRYVHRGGRCLFSNIVVGSEYGVLERNPALSHRITAAFQEQDAGTQPFNISLENIDSPRKAGSPFFRKDQPLPDILTGRWGGFVGSIINRLEMSGFDEPVFSESEILSRRAMKRVIQHYQNQNDPMNVTRIGLCNESGVRAFAGG